MKKIIFIAGIFFLAPLLAPAQVDYKVVIDLTSKDSLTQKMALRWASEVAAIKDAKAEVVMYGPGVFFATKDGSPYQQAINNLLAEHKNVSLKVCAVAMKNLGVDASQLLPGVEIVPDGIYEVISKQHEGWGYIKVAR